MTISRLVYAVEVVGTQYLVSPIDGSISLDELYTPFVAGNVRIALPSDPAVLDALDPRKGGRVRVSISRQFGTPFTLAAITAGSGTSTAEWTADLAEGPVSTWTDRYGTPFNSSGSRASASRRFNLGVRSMVSDHEQGVLDLRIESDESLLLDYALVQTAPAQPNGNTVRQAAQMVLARIGAVLGDGPDDGPIEAEAAPWMPGQGAWDYIKPLVDSAGLRLYCDERRVWHLVQPLAPTRGSLAFSGANATLLQDQVARDEDWYDAVVITYRWTDSGGTDRVAYDMAAVEDATRVMSLDYDRPFPGAGAADAILSRARGRGRVEAVTAVLNPDATPGQAMTVSLANIPTQTGMSTHVTFDMSGDVMQVRSRDLTDTPPNAWVLAPYGLTWNDIPTGTSWDDFDLTEVGA